MSNSDYLELQILRWVTGQTNDLGTAATPWVALYTVAPTDAGGGTEVTGGSYARVNSSGLWAVPGPGSVSNNTAITFPAATANWGTVVAFGLLSASSGGNLLRWALLGASKAVDNGDTASFAVSALTLTQD